MTAAATTGPPRLRIAVAVVAVVATLAPPRPG